MTVPIEFTTTWSLADAWPCRCADSRERKEGLNMFGRRKKGPSKPFTHGDDCRIQTVDPDVEIPWSYVGDGPWKAECVCTMEYYREPFTDNRVRLDPHDPKTSRHAPECEFASTTEPSVVRVLLRVREGMAPGYWWVECGACDTAWQVPYYAASVG